MLNIFILSGNQLSGPIPFIFDNILFNRNFCGNTALCGSLRLPSCASLKGRFQNSSIRVALILISAGVAVTCSIHIGSLYKKYITMNFCSHTKPARTPSWKLTSFQGLEFNVEVDILKLDGKVYMVTLSNGQIIAVKKIWISEKAKPVQDKGVQAKVDTL
eukprot:Gb_21090 [translate_table: standard]